MKVCQGLAKLSVDDMGWQLPKAGLIVCMTAPLMLSMNVGPQAADNCQPEALWLGCIAMHITSMQVCMAQCMIA